MLKLLGGKKKQNSKSIAYAFKTLENEQNKPRKHRRTKLRMEK